MNLELTATEELRIVADINVDIAFNTNATITALTDENSYIGITRSIRRTRTNAPFFGRRNV